MPAELDRLREALEDERPANAQLDERVRDAARAAGNADAADLREQVARSAKALAQLDSELQRLRQANDACARYNAALREANAQGVGEPHLINKAMLAELEALRAARSAERGRDAGGSTTRSSRCSSPQPDADGRRRA